MRPSIRSTGWLGGLCGWSIREPCWMDRLMTARRCPDRASQDMLCL
uniref:Uncharacterized protein n=1 Tax=Picea glauca TaxID=3330 RepID=A0A124GN20_PICGL|nr:hypothetical protein ABT39_MTgene5623 [Picea glauca]